MISKFYKITFLPTNQVKFPTVLHSAFIGAPLRVFKCEYLGGCLCVCVLARASKNESMMARNNRQIRPDRT